MLATLNEGDEAIIPTPCWVSYPDIVALAGGKPVFVACGQNHGFKLRADDLAAAITPRTRWFILNNPCNPTGAAYTAADLRPLCDVLLRHPDVWVLTDDIYEKIAYDEVPATIVQVEPRLKDRTVTMNGCLQGLRDDRLAHRLCGRAAAVDQGDGQAAEPVHLQHIVHRPGRGAGGADRTDGFHRRHGARVPPAPRYRGGDAECRARHHVPQTGRHVLRVSLDGRLPSQDHAARHADHGRSDIRHRVAGGGRRGTGAWHGVPVPRTISASATRPTPKPCAKRAHASNASAAACADTRRGNIQWRPMQSACST